MTTCAQDAFLDALCEEFDGAPIEVLELTSTVEGPILAVDPSGAKFVVEIDGAASKLNPTITSITTRDEVISCS